MNWRIEGKKAGGKKGKLTIVGGPETEEKLREAVKGSHPTFEISSATPVDGDLKPLAAAAPAAK